MKTWLEKAFFIVGCQRSGTTLLRLVLECHSMIRCRDEMTAYQVLAGEMPEQDDGKIIGFKVPSWTEQLDEDDVHDIGTKARRFYSGQKILFMVRDPRDVIASMLRLKMDSELSWMDDAGLRHFQKDKELFVSKFPDETAKALRFADIRVGLAAVYWLYKTSSYFDYIQKGYPVMGVGYEKLVSDPEPLLRAVCSFIGVPWEQNLLRHPELPHQELKSSGLATGASDPKRAIDKKSVGKWSDILNADAVSLIEEITGPVWEKISRAL